jgi:hypothetical protein
LSPQDRAEVRSGKIQYVVVLEKVYLCEDSLPKSTILKSVGYERSSSLFRGAPEYTLIAEIVTSGRKQPHKIY